MGVPTLWAVLQALVACASAAQALSAGGGSPTPSPVWLTGDDETGCLARYDFVDAKFLGGGKPMFKTEGAPPPCSRSGQAWLVHLGGEWQVVTGNVLAGMVREHLGVRSDAALPSQVKGAWSQYRRGQLLGKTGVYARDHAGVGGAAREHRLPAAERARAVAGPPCNAGPPCKAAAGDPRDARDRGRGCGGCGRGPARRQQGSSYRTRDLAGSRRAAVRALVRARQARSRSLLLQAERADGLGLVGLRRGDAPA